MAGCDVDSSELAIDCDVQSERNDDETGERNWQHSSDYPVHGEDPSFLDSEACRAMMEDNNQHVICEKMLAMVEEMKFSNVLQSHGLCAREEEACCASDVLRRQLQRRGHSRQSSLSDAVSVFGDDAISINSMSPAITEELSRDDSRGRPTSGRSREPSISSSEGVSVALNYFRHADSKMPTIEELTFLVSDDDCPQSLLSLPESRPVGHDTPGIRGTSDWAPPRRQVIFSIPTKLKSLEQAESQRYKCAGCGQHIEKTAVRHLRYCTYFGKLFCHSALCHNNDLTIVPAYILQRGDYTRLPVSHFAATYLRSIGKEPLFDISVVAKDEDGRHIAYKSKRMQQVRSLRIQLGAVRGFVANCRNAGDVQALLEKFPNYWLYEINMYSLTDLIDIRQDSYFKEFKSTVDRLISHARSCALCCARGFVCEVCRNSRVIFPFEIATVVVCPKCFSCFHRKCFTHCLKCARNTARSKSNANRTEEAVSTSS